MTPPRVETDAAGPRRAVPTELLESVAVAKGADALAPVTVVCPSGWSAVFVRRSLASFGSFGRAVHPPSVTGAGPFGPRGVANVATTTVEAFVGSLAEPELARRGLRPVTPALDLATIRCAALERGGWIAGLAAHAGAFAALERSVRELRECPPSVLEAVAARGERARALVELVRCVRDRLRSSGLADEWDVASAALEASNVGANDAFAVTRGPVLLFELGGLSGPHAEVLRRIGARRVPARRRSAEEEMFSEVRPCSHPEQEARRATRAVLEAAESGVASWRQAVFHPHSADYSRVLHEHLASAGLPRSGPAAKPLSGYACVRALLGLLDLCEGSWGRDDVAAWLSAAPLWWREGATLVPASRWDSVSAAAGVVSGEQQWRERLARHAAQDHEDAADSRSLVEFVDGLVARSRPPSDTWSRQSAWLRGLFDDYVLDETSASSWPCAELEAAVELHRVLESLQGLDQVSERTDVAGFRLVLEALLERTQVQPRGTERAGAEHEDDAEVAGFEEGVFVAPMAAARGLEFAQVVVCGLAEEVLPGPLCVDPLLDEEARTGDGTGTLRTRARTREDQGEDLVCAVRAGTELRVATFPCTDPRSGRSMVPSRWLARLAPARSSWHPVESFSSSLSGSGPPLDADELDLHALNGWAALGGDVERSPVAAAEDRLRVGLGAIRSRDGRSFTRFDGLVGTGVLTPFDPGAPVSATRFETYAHCPRRYLFERALGVRARVLPEDLWRMEPAERGSLVHAILESYVEERVKGAPRSLERLLEIAHTHFESTEARGLVGRPLLWKMDRAAIVRELRRFHHEEGELTPVAAELSFGNDDEGGAAAVVVELEDGRRVHFRGSADRVDRSPTGRLVVSDYKTGKQSRLAELLRDPVASGTLLQLPLYGLAARGHFGGTGTVHARYWLLSTERNTAFYNLAVTDAVEARFKEVIGRIASGVEAGCFPAVPGAATNDHFQNCRYCDFDRVCPPDRDRQWSRKMSDPALEDVVGLVREETGGAFSGMVVKGFVDPDGAEACAPRAERR